MRTARARPWATVRTLIWAGLILRSTFALAWGDGMILVPAPALRSFSEQYSGAVVSVNPDRTADIDLFISLATSLPEPQQVHFLLPLQTVPTAFDAWEQTQQQFSNQKLRPLDEVLREGAGDERLMRRSIRDAYKGASFLLGPWSLPWLYWGWEPSFWAGPVGDAERAGPVLSATTKHTSADIYPSLQPGQLAALAGLPDLPDSVRQTLGSYTGRPFALVRLRLTPSEPGAGKQPTGDRDTSPSGVRFSFRQQLLPDRSRSAYRYDFPLGTGRAWTSPIAFTSVYVTAREDLNLRVHFPDRPLPKAGTEADARARPRLLAWGAAVHERQRQVYAAVYSPEAGDGNPSRDVRVELRVSGVPELVARRESAHRRARILSATFPFLAILAGLTVALAFLPWGRGEGVVIRFLALAACWLAAQGFQLLLLVVVSLPASYLLGKDDPGPSIIVISILLWLPTAGWMAWLSVRKPMSGVRASLCRVPLTALASCLIYLGFGFVFRVLHAGVT